MTTLVESHAGFSPATPYHQALPCGGSEAAHLVYLLVLEPLLILFSTILLIIFCPYSIFYFALEVILD